jgi:hypothetical protein
VDWDKLITAAVAVFFGFLGGFSTIIAMRSDIQTLKQQRIDAKNERDRDRAERDAMYSIFRDELREIRQSQERHYMNLVAMLKGGRH